MQTRGRRKRERSPLACRFSGCGSRFQSVAAQRAHHRSHTGDTPWRCEEDGCTARFPVRRALAVHVRNEHRKSAEAAEETPSVGGIETTGALDDDGAAWGKSAAVDADAAEIADNCVYFVTQLRAARGKGIERWTDDDLKNAQGWASYVCEQVGKPEDEEAVSNAVRPTWSDYLCCALRPKESLTESVQQLGAKNLSLAAMRTAERALFDAVLGYDGVSEKMLSALCESIQEPRSEQALAESLAASMERKAVLGALAEAAGAGDDVLHEAAARVLRNAHRKKKGAPGRTHMAEVASTNIGCELLLREAVLCGVDDECGQDAIAAVLSACDSRGEILLRSIPPDVVTEACELSFPLFDRYVARLLTVCARDQESDASAGSALDAEARLRLLLARAGRVSFLTAALLRRYVLSAERTPSRARIAALLRSRR